MVVFESVLPKKQFIRLSILRHIQRTTFYFYALTCALVTAYVYAAGASPIFLLVVWLSFLLYILLGVINAYQASRVEDAPYFLPTRYEFSPRGVQVKTSQAKSKLEWKEFSEWKKIIGCYVLILVSGAYLAIPQSAVPEMQSKQFEQLLKQYIK
ncbi:MAG: YcxB family protein [Ardenticatenaceae bacterium]